MEWGQGKALQIDHAIILIGPRLHARHTGQWWYSLFSLVYELTNAREIVAQHRFHFSVRSVLVWFASVYTIVRMC